MRNKTVYVLLALYSMLQAVSCSKMDDNFREYVVPGGITYIGRADSVFAYPGKGRILLTWIRGTDLKAKKAVVYWNNFMDSVIVPIPDIKPRDSVKVMIPGLLENTYTFNIYTMDDRSNRSVKVEKQGVSLGSVYESTLQTRLLYPVVRKANTVTMNWSYSDPASFATEIIYTDLAGVEQKIFMDTVTKSLPLADVKFNTFIRYRGLYMPNKYSLDTFYTAQQQEYFGQNLTLGNTLKASSGTPGSTADENTATLWTPTAADRTGDKLVWISADLKTPTMFNKVKQFFGAGNTVLAGYKIYGSNDEAAWTLILDKPGKPLPNEDAEFPAVTYRYLKVEHAFATDANFTVSELEIYNKP